MQNRWQQSFRPSTYRATALMGDLNAHHPWWQGPLPLTVGVSRASQAIADWLEDNNFPLKMSLQYLHTIPGTVDAPQPLTCTSPEALPCNPFCHWQSTTILPPTIAPLPLPCRSKQPQHQKFPAGAGIGPIGESSTPEFSLPE